MVKLHSCFQNVSRHTQALLTLSWSQRLLQLFATESRPLVLVIDDCQWLEASEVGLWRHFLESRYALNHMLVACAYRVEENVAPPAPMLLSSTSTQLMVDKLPEEGVLKLLEACFHDRLDKASSLVSFLHAETAGSPLYLRSLLNTLVSHQAVLLSNIQVRDHIVYFDFTMLLWRFDPLALQSHLTNRKVDEFLGSIMREFPVTTQQILKVCEVRGTCLTCRCYRVCHRLVYPLVCSRGPLACLCTRSRPHSNRQWPAGAPRPPGLDKITPPDSVMIVIE